MTNQTPVPTATPTPAADPVRAFGLAALSVAGFPWRDRPTTNELDRLAAAALGHIRAKPDAADLVAGVVAACRARADSNDDPGRVSTRAVAPTGLAAPPPARREARRRGRLHSDVVGAVVSLNRLADQPPTPDSAEVLRRVAADARLLMNTLYDPDDDCPGRYDPDRESRRVALLWKRGRTAGGKLGLAAPDELPVPTAADFRNSLNRLVSWVESVASTRSERTAGDGRQKWIPPTGTVETMADETPPTPDQPYITAAEIAARLGKAPGPVQVFLCRLHKSRPGCRIRVPNPGRGSAKFVYVTEEVWPAVLAKSSGWPDAAS